eukprot:3299768-Rhodomonas_salina.5
MPSPTDLGLVVESEADWQQQTLEDSTEQAGDMLRLLQRQYDKLVTAMERESVAKLISQQQHDFDAGRKKVVQRFLGKMAPIPSLWGVLPRAARRQYQWILTLRGEAQTRFVEWIGEGFKEAVRKGVQLHCSNTFHLR